MMIVKTQMQSMYRTAHMYKQLPLVEVLVFAFICEMVVPVFWAIGFVEHLIVKKTKQNTNLKQYSILISIYNNAYFIKLNH